VEIPQPTPRRSTWERNPPKMYFYLDSFILSFTKNREPYCYYEVKNNINNDKWKMEMKEEIDSLEKSKTWYLAELLEDGKIVGYKWVQVEERC